MSKVQLTRQAASLLLLALCTSTELIGVQAAPDGVIAGEQGQNLWAGEVIQLSWKPRAYLLKGFLTDEECDHLIETARPHMVKSAVVNNQTGKSEPSKIRTSTGTFFAQAQDDIIARIERRIAQVTMLPEENQEGMQILHYENGQKYEPHYDYFHDKVNADANHGGQRVLTMLMYLTTVDEGGETVFPNADRKVEGEEWSDCAKGGLAVKTFKGDALMFFSLHPDNTPDNTSLHGSCPTLAGEKWSATKWIHVSSFKAARGRPTGCLNLDDKCDAWAAMGECEANPVFMKSSCAKACHAC